MATPANDNRNENFDQILELKLKINDNITPTIAKFIKLYSIVHFLLNYALLSTRTISKKLRKSEKKQRHETFTRT